MRAATLDRARLEQAFAMLGEDLASRSLFVEVAVYGGSALIMQFGWRRVTEDVDAVVRPGYDESVLEPSVARVAQRLGLPDDWLNNAVGMFTPLEEHDSLFAVSGTYPESGRPGLRVLLARPHYLLALKLDALSSLGRGDRDLRDARHLAAALDLRTMEALRQLYTSIHGRAPRDEIERQLGLVVADG